MASIQDKLSKPWLLFPAVWGHHFAPTALKIYSSLFPSEHKWEPFKWKGLEFNNRLGWAGGFDKNADLLSVSQKMGLGFHEIGTITPLAQGPNEGKIIARNLAQLTLWNKMGFPNKGGAKIYKKLSSYQDIHIPVFVNIGKNRATPLDQALSDYLKMITLFEPRADVFVVNISSPNTQGLRQLQDKSHLAELAKNLRAATKKPILIKLSPDLSDTELYMALDQSLGNGADGFILTNTTLSRKDQGMWPKEGGLSGTAVKNLSKEMLKKTISVCKKNGSGPLIISVGGVLTEQDVFERLELGADLVQIYTAMVFNGPVFIKKVAQFHGSAQNEKHG